jgi:phosphatidylglycerol lysyltransferase
LDFRGKWNGYIAFKKCFQTAVVLGDPVVPEEDLSEAIKDFKTECSSKNIHICFFICSDKIITSLIGEGFKGFLIGNEAVIDLNKFTLSGRKAWSIRSSINHAVKKGMVVEEYRFKERRSPSIENELHRITNEWCKIKRMHELTFAFGHVEFDTFEDARYFICKKDDRIVGFLTYFPIYGKKSYYLDLTRREIHAPRGTIDFLMVKSFEVFKNEGIEKIFIGYSPVKYSLDSYLSSKLLMFFYPAVEFFYPARSEFFFKNKYATGWQPNYFFYYPRISIRMLLALVNSIYTGGIASILLNKARYLFKK